MKALEVMTAAGQVLGETRRIASILFVHLAQSQQLDDVTISETPHLFPKWDENWTGKAGTILQDEGVL